MFSQLIQLFKPFRLAHYQKKVNKEGELFHSLLQDISKNPYESILWCIEYVTELRIIFRYSQVQKIVFPPLTFMIGPLIKFMLDTNINARK